MWKWAAGALKDTNSLLKATLITRRSAYRIPDIDAAVINATTHNDSHVDYCNTQRIFAWLRFSDHYFRPVMAAIAKRMERTRSWMVALKGLMLLHGIFCCKVPAVQKMGRLPFDLSSFKDRDPEMSNYNAFIRSYYAYLDQKSSFMFLHSQEQRIKKQKDKEYSSVLMRDLVWLEKLQRLLDMLLDIKPQSDVMMNVLVLEAMDCVVIETFDIYSRICNGIAGVLVRIYSAEKTEAETALSVMQKVAVQGEALSVYFQYCRDFGVMKASECPKTERISDEEIRELQSVINMLSDQCKSKDFVLEEEAKSIIVIEDKKTHKAKDSKTIITNDWEVSDEEQKQSNEVVDLICLDSPPRKTDANVNPFVVEVADLISL